jgi:hypothetical protein
MRAFPIDRPIGKMYRWLSSNERELIWLSSRIRSIASWIADAGAFCKTDKEGNALNEPPRSSRATAQQASNPRGVRHPGKTAQDFRCRSIKRPRVIAAKAQLGEVAWLVSM